MYIVYGQKIEDTEEIGKIIKENTDFKILKDMSKGSKREDIAAFNVSVSIDILNSILKEEFDVANASEDDLFDEYMVLAEDMVVELEDFLPEYSKTMFKGYKWDLSDNEIRGIIIVCNLNVKNNKMLDVMRRLETQVE